MANDERSSEDVHRAGFTRREAMLAAAVLPTTGAGLPGTRPMIVRTPLGARISYSGEYWDLSLSQFADGAQLSTDAELLTLKLSKAAMPGTDFRVDLNIRLYEDDIGWRIYAHFERLGPGASADLPLIDWLGSKAGTSRAASIPLPPKFQIRAGSKSAPFLLKSLTRSPRLSFGADNTFRLTGDLALLLDGHSLAARATSISSRHSAATTIMPGFADGVQATLISIERSDMVVDQNASHIPVGRLREAGIVSVFGSGEKAEVAALQLATGQGAIARISIGGGLELRTAGRPVELLTDDLTITAVRGFGRPNQTILDGHLSATGFALQLGRKLVSLRGDPAKPFQLAFSAGARPPFVVPAMLEKISVAVKGADAATLKFVNDTPIRIALDGLPTISDTQSSGEAAMRLGAHPELRADLAGSRLHVRRHLDLLNLGFELAGFTLRVLPGHVRISPIAGASQRLVVHVGSQHLAEKAYPTKVVGKAEVPIGLDAIVPARAAAPSRLAFEVSGQALKRSWLDLETLLDWSSLPPVVSDRARPDDVEKFLKRIGVTPSTERFDAISAIMAVQHPPGPTEMALEPSYRLTISTDGTERWENAGSAEPLDGAYPLWYARVADSAGGKNFRILGARGANLKWIADPNESVPTNPWPQDNPYAPIDAPHRLQAMLLSSVDGLPALLRGDGVHSGGTVRPMPSGWAMLNEGEAREGLYISTPLKQTELVLTSLGSTFKAEGSWEPPRTGDEAPSEKEGQLEWHRS